MSDSLKESLSALLDNEADELELRRILQASRRDPELLLTWQRFSLVQAALRDGARPLGPDFADRVLQQLEAEPRVSASGRFLPWQQNLARLAIAASVAAVFFVALQVGLAPDSATPEMAATSPEPANLAESLLADASQPEHQSAQQIAPLVRAYIDSIYIDNNQPPMTEHMQDSPLYRLVNELGDQR